VLLDHREKDNVPFTALKGCAVPAQDRMALHEAGSEVPTAIQALIPWRS
jgi:hypothetical protein